MANDIQYGLSSYVWTENLGRAHRVAAAIEAGMCFVNSQNVRDLRQPFGGTKASGTGREGGTWSYEVFLEPKNVAVSLGCASHSALGRLSLAVAVSRRPAMGKLALAAKITHVPSMYLSELDGPRKGSRQAAIDGHVEIGRRCRELGVDTIVRVRHATGSSTPSYHVMRADFIRRCARRRAPRRFAPASTTSNELPHFISNLDVRVCPGNPALGQLLAQVCNEPAWTTLAHPATTLGPEYGTLVPMRYMNADQHFKVVSVSALCTVHYLNDSARLGWAMRQAGSEEHYDGTRGLSSPAGR